MSLKNVLGLLNAVESAQTQILVEHFQHLAESVLPRNSDCSGSRNDPYRAQYRPVCW